MPLTCVCIKKGEKGVESASWYTVHLRKSSGSRLAGTFLSIDRNFFNSVAADDGGMPVLEETHSIEEALSFDIVLDKLHELNQRFSTTPAACVKIMQRLNHITTATQWETFVQTQGASVNCSYRSGSAIRVQPTSLSRRRPAVTRGSTEPLTAPRGGRPEGQQSP